MFPSRENTLACCELRPDHNLAQHTTINSKCHLRFFMRSHVSHKCVFLQRVWEMARYLVLEGQERQNWVLSRFVYRKRDMCLNPGKRLFRWKHFISHGGVDQAYSHSDRLCLVPHPYRRQSKHRAGTDVSSPVNAINTRFPETRDI